jgi:hypothetical protein
MVEGKTKGRSVNFQIGIREKKGCKKEKILKGERVKDR